MPKPIRHPVAQDIHGGRRVPCAGCARDFGDAQQGHPPALCFMEKVRNEVRLVSLHGHVAGALPAQPGGKQINLVVQVVNT